MSMGGSPNRPSWTSAAPSSQSPTDNVANALVQRRYDHMVGPIKEAYGRINGLTPDTAPGFQSRFQTQQQAPPLQSGPVQPPMQYVGGSPDWIKNNPPVMFNPNQPAIPPATDVNQRTIQPVSPTTVPTRRLR